MLFDPPLLPARLVRRYKRFFADVVLADGRAATAHCPNPGAMTGLADPGAEVWVAPVEGRAPSQNARRLPYRLELVRDAGTGALVGVNTGRANGLVAEALAAGGIRPLASCADIVRECAVAGGSRIDFRFADAGGRICYLEVKSVTLKRDAAHPGTAEFPDAKTERGARHMAALAGLTAAGTRAIIFYLVQRSDAARFTLAADIDPAYAAAFAAARAAGVEALAYACEVGTAGISVARPLPLAGPIAT